MRENEVQLYLVLDKLGYPLDKLRNPDGDGDKYPENRSIQAMIYLFQRCGVSLGYEFQWLEDIPYCYDLTWTYRHLKSAIDCSEKDHTWYQIDNVNPIVFETCNTLLENPKSVSADKPKWAEFLSAIDYLNKSVNRPYTIQDEDVRDYIKNLYKDRIEKFDFCYKLAVLRLDNFYAISG